MHRIQIEGEPGKDVAEWRKRLKDEGFTRLESECVARGEGHPGSKEEYFEERFQHPDGNVVRLFPHCRIVSGERRGDHVAYLIEFKA